MEKEEFINSLIGKGEAEVKEICMDNGLDFRIVRRDKESYIVTMDLRPDRVNLEIDYGKVSKAYFG